MQKTKINSRYTSWTRYEKMVNGFKYKGFELKIDPIAKYEGQLMIEYKYRIEKLNTIEDVKNGAQGYVTIYPVKMFPIESRGTFKGFSTDIRYQLTKEDMKNQFHGIVDRIIERNHEK